MLRCKGPARNWHLQMVTDLHFHAADHRYNFNSPVWPLLFIKPHKELSAETEDVFELLESAGALIQEVFGLNYYDIIQMDLHTYTRFKQHVMNVYEKRLKDQQEQEEEAERQRREEELQRQREEQQRNRENRNQ